MVNAEPGAPFGFRDENHGVIPFTLAGLGDFELEHSVDFGLDEFPSSGTHPIGVEPDGLRARLRLHPVLSGLDGA